MHSTPQQRRYKEDQMGENIAMKWTSTGDDFTGKQCTDEWYSEIERFNFKTSSGPRTGKNKIGSKLIRDRITVSYFLHSLSSVLPYKERYSISQKCAVKHEHNMQ